MGLRPTQDEENTFVPATALYGSVALPFVIPSEARDLQFRGPFVEMFFDKAYPDLLPRGTRRIRVCASP